MILIKQLDNQLGGSERQTQYLVGELRRRSIPFRLSYVHSSTGSRSILMYEIDAIYTLVSMVKYKPTAIYFMVGLAPNSLFQSLMLTYPYLVVGIVGRIFNIHTVIRLVKSGDYDRLMNYVPERVLECFDYICLSRYEQKSVRRFNKVSRVEYLVNGVDTTLFRPKIKKNSEFVYGYMGSFSKEKNLLLLVRAYAMLPREVRIKSKLVLIGANPPNCCRECSMATAELIREIDKLGLVKQIIIKPYIPLTTIDSAVSEYNSFDVAVLTSAQEGCPNMVLESLACGVPVLFYSGAKEVSEIVGRNVGISFNKLMPQNIAVSLEKVFDEGKTLAKNARKYAVANFCIIKTIDGVIEFLA